MTLLLLLSHVLLTFSAMLIASASASGKGLSSMLLSSILYTEPDYGLPTPDLVHSRGFGYERHYVETQDGFQLAIHRIVHPFRRRETRATVLMLHGFTGSANNFLDSTPDGHVNEPLTYIGGNGGFEIAKRGFDVWLLDQRAVQFSDNNTKYSKHDASYWDWDSDSLTSDLQSVIEYVLNVTVHPRIACVAHSQASKFMMQLMTSVPRYNYVIRPLIAVAPLFYMKHTSFTRGPLGLLPYQQLEQLFSHWNLPLASTAETFKNPCWTRAAAELLCKPIGYLLMTHGRDFGIH